MIIFFQAQILIKSIWLSSAIKNSALILFGVMGDSEKELLPWMQDSTQ
mgnify:CR=1 FL=1